MDQGVQPWAGEEWDMAKEAPAVRVVDDDEAVRNALVFALNAEGFDARSFGSSAALLAEQLPARTCLLVVDYRMPDVDGLELIESLRHRQIDLPVILISGSVSKDLRQKAARLGVCNVLEKPLVDSLVRLIRRLLDGQA